MDDKPTEFELAFAEMAGPESPPADEGQQGEAPQVASQDAEPLATAPEQPAEEAADPKKDELPKDEPPEPADKPITIEDLFSLVPQDKQESFKSVIQQVRSDLGRVSALNKLYAEQRAQAEAAQKQVQEAQAAMADLQKKIEQAGTNPTADQRKEIQEDADDLERQFPELAKAVTLRFKRLIREELPTLAAGPAKTPEAAAEPKKQEPSSDKAVDETASEYAALNAAHPDWQHWTNRQEFATWFKSQPQSMQELRASNKAKDAIVLLDAFKRDLSAARSAAEAERKEANRKRLEQNVEVRSAAPRISSPPNDFEAAFNWFASR